LGGMLLGHTCVCAVEIEPYCRKVLLQRQRDGILPKFPIWDDVRTFDGKPWRGLVDVVCGGFPCQDISSANTNSPRGIDGERSGMWTEMARLVREIRPSRVFVENSPMLTLRGLGRVLGDLATMGYDAKWGVLGANDAGAPHRRERIWIAANSKQISDDQYVGVRRIQMPRAASVQLPHVRDKRIRCETWKQLVMDTCGMAPEKWWAEGYGIDSRPLLLRNDDGLADGMDRLEAIGNGQVPAVVELAWRMLSA
jgi:DNA (cytosine-5)-methyltransferase 1